MTKPNATIGFHYPIYTVNPINRNTLVIAGGGGKAKTGVPNRIDIVDCAYNDNSHQPVKLQTAGGVDTGPDAVMSLVVLSGGKGVFFATLEGSRCVEYFAQLKSDSLNVNSTSKNSDDTHERLVGYHESSGLTQSESSVRKRKNKKHTKSSNKVIESSDETKVKDINRNDHGNCANNTTIVNGLPSSEWEIVKIREYLLGANENKSSVDSGSESPSDLTASKFFGLPNCVAQCNSNFCSYIAIGSERGAVCLINHKSPTADHWNLVNSEQDQSFIYPDVSCGRSASVCSLAIGSVFASKSDQMRQSLLATICEQPDWNHLRVWKLPNQFISSNIINATAVDEEHLTGKFPYAIAVLSDHNSLFKQSNKTNKPNDHQLPNSNYRFRHCQFMNYHQQETTIDEPDSKHILMVTTVQPICASRHCISYLIVWSVPSPSVNCFARSSSSSSSSNDDLLNEPIKLNVVCSINLPNGQLPSCLTTHPSRQRGLIAVGTMTGAIEVYFLSAVKHQLIPVYNVRNAHPIFVTSLTFLSPVGQPINQSSVHTFNLVSVSADAWVKWHTGPDYSFINKLSRGLVQSNAISNYYFKVTNRIADSGANLICLLLLLFLPIYLVIIENVITYFL